MHRRPGKPACSVPREGQRAISTAEASKQARRGWWPGAAGGLGSTPPRAQPGAPSSGGGAGGHQGGFLLHRAEMASQDSLPLSSVPSPPGSCPWSPAVTGLVTHHVTAVTCPLGSRPHVLVISVPPTTEHGALVKGNLPTKGAP